MAPVVLALKERKKEFDCKVVVTAQHRDMLDQVMRLFDIKSDHDLNIMTGGQTLTDVTVRGLERLEPVLKSEKPDLVLVHGDTTTALAATLAAFYQRVPVGHVEAGLRSHDIHNPFPEEINRVAADAICALHFAPTDLSRKNLLKENISPRGIFITGNTGIDALKLGIKRMNSGHFAKPSDEVQALSKHHFILVTAHRRENFGQPFVDLCQSIRDIALKRKEIHFIYPVHPNPNVLQPVNTYLSNLENVHLLKPLDYADLIFLLQKALFVLTDSGGIQEEAPSVGKPVLVLRKVTERPEAVKAGTVKLVGTDPKLIHTWITKLLDDKKAHARMAGAHNPYGDGMAAERTVEAIRYFFGMRTSRPGEFKTK